MVEECRAHAGAEGDADAAGDSRRDALAPFADGEGVRVIHEREATGQMRQGGVEARGHIDAEQSVELANSFEQADTPTVIERAGNGDRPGSV